MKPINVLSCFDGISAGQVALERAGIPVRNYYSFEIDKYAIQVTQSHYPNTIQLGDIQEWKKWRNKIPVPDLIIGGSPCQGFSNAGRGLNFDDPRSKLFFVFVDIIKYYKKKNPSLLFLLENVRMKKEWQNVITEYMGVEPVRINSALLSAQNRVRLYWTNFGEIEQPEDRCLYLKDVIVDGEVNREKSYTIDANYFKGGNPRSKFEDGKRQLVFEHQSQKRAMVKIRSLYLTDKEKVEMSIKKGAKTFASGKSEGNIQFPQTLDRKSLCLLANGTIGSCRTTNVIDDGYGWRKLTPVECERLQTFEDNWTQGISDTQRYKCLGNSWTVDVIVHLLGYFKKNTQEESPK